MTVRRILEVSVCLLVGFGSSTGIAWICVVSQLDRMDFRLVYGPKSASDAEPGLLDSPCIERFLALAIDSSSVRETARQASVVECMQAPGFGVCVREISCNFHEGGNDPAIVLGESIEAGRPWTSLMAVRALQPGFRSGPVGSTGWLEILAAFEGGSFGEPVLFSLRSGLALPIHPLVVGSILNATLYGTMLAAALAGSRTARSRWRRLRGRCEGCGYQIAGARDIRCPECGRRDGWRSAPHAPPVWPGHCHRVRRLQPKLAGGPPGPVRLAQRGLAEERRDSHHFPRVHVA